MRFSVGSLNLRCGRCLDEPYPVVAAAQAAEADVLLVQENWRPQGSPSLAQQVGEALSYDSVLELDLLSQTSLHALGVVRDMMASEDGAWGIALLSRLPLVRREQVGLGTAPGDLAARSAQVVDLVGSDARRWARIVNVHLTHRLHHGLGQLRRLLQALPDDDVPTVVAGDLNMCRPTVYLARPFRPGIRGRTWPAKRPVVQIDHLLVSRAVAVSHQRIGPSVGSDHLPIRAVLAVEKAAEARGSRTGASLAQG
jgi:endonuclease/exonuclease/phosphatase family metal-dependent hydrolase